MTRWPIHNNDGGGGVGVVVVVTAAAITPLRCSRRNYLSQPARCQIIIVALHQHQPCGVGGGEDRRIDRATAADGRRSGQGTRDLDKEEIWTRGDLDEIWTRDERSGQGEDLDKGEIWTRDETWTRDERSGQADFIS
ncbi:unnamed protein product [Lampetra planeri]